MAASSGCRHILLTGPPGIGKTTLVKRVCKHLQDQAIPTQGFYTEEIRQGGQRQGFDIITLEGKRSVLSRKGDLVSDAKKRSSPIVGQYCVDIESFEELAIPVLDVEDSHRIYVVDEIGKMELFSKKFISTVRRIFDQPTCIVLATIPIARGKSLALVEDLRKRKDSRVVTVSKENRDSLVDEVVEVLTSSFRS